MRIAHLGTPSSRISSTGFRVLFVRPLDDHGRQIVSLARATGEVDDCFIRVGDGLIGWTVGVGPDRVLEPLYAELLLLYVLPLEEPVGHQDTVVLNNDPETLLS